MFSRNTLALDAGLIAKILRRLTPAECAEIHRSHARSYPNLPVLDFWDKWLGLGYGKFFSERAELLAFKAALHAWEVLRRQAQADSLEAAVKGLEALAAPVMPLEPHPARADDNALVLEMYELVEAGMQPWAAAEQVAPRARGVGNLDSKRRRLRGAFKRRYGV